MGLRGLQKERFVFVCLLFCIVTFCPFLPCCFTHLHLRYCFVLCTGFSFCKIFDSIACAFSPYILNFTLAGGGGGGGCFYVFEAFFYISYFTLV